MTPAEARELARMSGRTACGIEGLVEATHDAMFDDVYDLVEVFAGQRVRPVRVAHRFLTSHSFFWVRNGLRAATWAAGAVAHRTARGTESGLGSVRAQVVLGAVNGIHGDRLVDHESGLATVMTLRSESQDISITNEGLQEAYGRGHERVVIFLHGLVETEHAWRYRSEQRWDEVGVSYASRLCDESDWTPLTVRYNTGRAIRENGDSLADLIADLVRAWPGPLREIALVGHSMGGLVALTAVSHGDPEWTRLVRTVVTLGAPREGAPLERAAAMAVTATESLAPMRWFGGLIGVRSGGIRDLHDALQHPPLPSEVRDYTVLGSLTPISLPEGARQVGDGLVPIPKTRTVGTVVLPGLNHLDLLNHPLVYEHLRTWLGVSSPVTMPNDAVTHRAWRR